MTKSSLTQNQEEVTKDICEVCLGLGHETFSDALDGIPCKACSNNFANLEGKAEVYINLGGIGANAIGIDCDFQHIKALMQFQGTQVIYSRFEDSLVEDWYEAVTGESI